MIKDLLSKSKTTISFEVFPPKKDEDFQSVFSTLDALAKLDPDFISCTYGAGVSFLISQMFFDNDYFYRFLDMLSAMGISVLVCAGIMPITSAKQIGTSVTLSGSSVPKPLADIIANYGDNPKDMRKTSPPQNHSRGNADMAL